MWKCEDVNNVEMWEYGNVKLIKGASSRHLGSRGRRWRRRNE
ncbi:hypothetical protein NIASO_07475 [Niabella soli DSM 19437]|uniref:Uncharacterized protein n=1 Tax=Niabella soli DSM 19437 TaxID=929713 RepID=W0F6J1_9BACT|nr:hypothetical protein NIASO_07475 [Niabella soli DSM 19437]